MLREFRCQAATDRRAPDACMAKAHMDRRELAELTGLQ